jgi:hypothetical protein
MSEDILCPLDSFKAYAESGRAPRWTMAPDDLHGFLTALAMAGPLPCANWTEKIYRHSGNSKTSDILLFTVRISALP